MKHGKDCTCGTCLIMSAKYQPTVTSQPGEALEVEVELADNASIDEMAEAVEAAARAAGLA